MEWLLSFIPSWLPGWLGWCLYFIPVLFCLVGYFLTSMEDYREDLKKCKDNWYNPTLRLGTILGRFIWSFIPVVNLWSTCFDHFPRFFGNFIQSCEKILNTPLVPSRYVSKT